MEDNDNVLLCCHCKPLHAGVERLQESVEKLIKINEQILKNVKMNTDKIVTVEVEHAVMSETVKDTFDTVNEIKTTVEGLTKEHITLVPAQMTPHKQLHKNKCLLLGDSLVQEMQKTSEDIQITTMKGNRCKDLEIKIKDGPSYEDIYLVVGSNDCSSQNSIEQILEDCTLLVQQAKQKANMVVLSSIPPRDDDDGLAVDEKMKEVNEKFKKVAEKEGVKFINHNSNFRYLNGSYEDELLKTDKLHLSEKRVNRLITNIGLKEKVKSATPGGNNWWKHFTLKGSIPDRIPRRSTVH